MAKKVGRQTKCTPELTAKICEEISKGAPIYAACQRNGLGERTFYLWLEKARENEDVQDNIYVQFMQAVKEADSLHECECATTASEAARKRAIKDNDVIHLITYMERRWPSRWSRQTRLAGQVDHQHQHKHTHKVEYTRLQELPEERKQAIVEEMIHRIEEYKSKQLPLEAEVVEATDKGDEGVDADPQGPTTKKGLPG